MGSKSNASNLGKSKAASTTVVKASNATREVAAAPDSQVIEREIRNVWHSVKTANENRGKNNAIIAVVPETQIKTMQDKIKKRGKDLLGSKLRLTGNQASKVLVGSEKNLQHLIEQVANSIAEPSKGKAKSLRQGEVMDIIVSYAINMITYRIPATVKTVKVDACQGSPPAYKLNIGLRSTYCEVNTFNWFHQGNKMLDKRSLEHSPKCFFDCNEDMDQVRALAKPPTDPIPLPTAIELAGMKDMFVDLTKECMEQESKKKNDTHKVSPGVVGSSSPQTDGTETWFQKWKAVLATVIVIASGIAGAGTFTTGWVTAAGVYIKGPCGLAISAGYFHGAVVSGTVLTGVGTGIVVPASTVIQEIQNVRDAFLGQAFSRAVPARYG
ncbi:hypothetical protein BBAD15_g10349 [Beauveria bassiana D1-5]|uniref:Uncharacterized protein n=1 Tax=Beauveria bassiana D1-5 TaxID=1245745 RepID=A0A0A2VUD3_BEABA|nr:hypothetical protein BBAD15_g10349 [Beauveria bassiana D1-5]